MQSEERLDLEETLVLLKETMAERSAAEAALIAALFECEHEERRRAADVLHDDLQQSLVVARMQLDRLQTCRDPATLVDLIRGIESSLDTLQQSAHALGTQLHPGALHDSSLSEAIAWLGVELKQRTDLEVRTELSRAAEPRQRSTRTFLFFASFELLQNVIQHAGVGEATVSLTCRNDTMQLCVTDRGNGIPPGATIASSRRRSGLHRLRDRAEALGGQLHVQSTLGHGTSVTLLVPSNIEGVPSEPRCPPLSVDPDGDAAFCAEPAPRSDNRPLRILVADDHAILRANLVTMLQDAGMDVVGQAASGFTAVVLALHLHPDVVLMDIEMPQMNGIRATRRLSQWLPDLRVIGVTMHEEEHIHARMRDAGARVVLLKSLRPDELVDTIVRVAS